jgi:hypothetical protein
MALCVEFECPFAPHFRLPFSVRWFLDTPETSP